MIKAVIILLVLVVAVSLWLLAGKWTEQYRENNVTWQVSGVVVDLKTRKPIDGVEIRANCREAITRKHKVDGAPVSSTNFVLKAAEDGRFNVNVHGGRIFLEFHRPGYAVSEWTRDSSKGRSAIATNLTIELVPDPK